MIDLFGGTVGGIFFGGFLYFIGMMIYLIGVTEIKDNVGKSGIGILTGVVFIIYFGLSFWGLTKFLSTSPILAVVSGVTFIVLLIKYPWWRN